MGSRGGAALDTTWEFLFNRTADLVNRYGPGSSITYSLGSVVEDLAKLVVSEQQAAKIKVRTASARPLGNTRGSRHHSPGLPAPP